MRLRELARHRGLKVNEYGVFQVESGDRIAGSSEEEVYASLSMQTPPPEIREDRGEIEAALKGSLPDLVTLEMIRGDLHVHTRDSDGFHTPREMREAAAELGYAWLGICNHAANLRVARGMSREDLLALADEIDKLNAAGDSPVTPAQRLRAQHRQRRGTGLRRRDPFPPRLLRGLHPWRFSPTRRADHPAHRHGHAQPLT